MSPRNKAESSTEKKGSIALTVWVKDTATSPSDTLVSTLPSEIKGRFGGLTYCGKVMSNP